MVRMGMREIDDVRLAFAIADRPGATHPRLLSLAIVYFTALRFTYAFYDRYVHVLYVYSRGGPLQLGPIQFTEKP